MGSDYLLSEAMEVGGLHQESEEESEAMEEEKELEAVGEEEEVEAVEEKEVAVLSTEAATPEHPRTYKRPRRVCPIEGCQATHSASCGITSSSTTGTSWGLSATSSL